MLVLGIETLRKLTPSPFGGMIGHIPSLRIAEGM
jgi:hypothetical protein